MDEPDIAAGDADGQFTRGIALLAQPADPGSFADGAALIEQAAAQGHAEATCQLATMEAIGAGRPQNWQRAFDYLKLAAERGSDHAQAQLDLLGGSSIDLARLLAVPDRQSLSDQPRIRFMSGFASAAECEWIMSKTRDKLGPALVWDTVGGMGRLDPNRSNRAVELRLTDMDVVMEVVRARISVATRLPEPIFETPQVMHYSVGQEFKPHHDFLDPNQPGYAADLAMRGQRIATFLIYLNDDYEGGETQFPKAGISHRGSAGDALFFANVTQDGAPDPLTLHAGCPPTSGEKWIFSQWIRDRSPGIPPSAAS